MPYRLSQDARGGLSTTRSPTVLSPGLTTSTSLIQHWIEVCGRDLLLGYCTLATGTPISQCRRSFLDITNEVRASYHNIAVRSAIAHLR